MPEQPTTDPSPTAAAPEPTPAPPATADTTSATAETAPAATETTPAATETTTAAPGSSVQPPASPEAPATPGSTSKRKKILSAIGTVAVVLLAKFGLGYMLSDKPAADTLSIGQCVQRGDDDAITAVDCGDKSADFKVVFIKKDTLESAADQTCSPYEATTMTFFESEKGATTGNTICLGAVR
ncbi:LppU/SCO3897 family protein [Terrabacter sp. 2RAF25]|uniref:LppU/SCO3897 family protein n=1 Tax=Terrabacter sp. 2RAF25 TaxID=3232998 RepID=UPI003F9B885E